MPRYGDERDGGVKVVSKMSSKHQLNNVFGNLREQCVGATLDEASEFPGLDGFLCKAARRIDKRRCKRKG